MKRPKVDVVALEMLRDKLEEEFISGLKDAIPMDGFAETHARNIVRYELEKLITERIYEIHLRNEAKRVQEEDGK